MPQTLNVIGTAVSPDGLSLTVDVNGSIAMVRKTKTNRYGKTYHYFSSILPKADDSAKAEDSEESTSNSVEVALPDGFVGTFGFSAFVNRLKQAEADTAKVVAEANAKAKAASDQAAALTARMNTMIRSQYAAGRTVEELAADCALTVDEVTEIVTAQ
jgi:hypothetical protein